MTVTLSPFTGTLFTGTTTLSLTVCLDLLCRFSESTVQGVVVVFEVLKFQEVSGPFAALLHGSCEVGGLGGGGGGTFKICSAGQVFGCRLVVLARSAVPVRLHTETTKKRN